MGQHIILKRGKHMDLIYILKAVVIAIVEGLTEFIPVSSTGHMIIANDMMKFGSTEFEKMFEVVIQLGAILAIVVLYWNKLIGLLKSLLRREQSGLRFAKAYLIALVPAGVLGVLFENMIDQYLFRTWTVLIGLFVGAILLLVIEKKYRSKAATTEVEQITGKQALKVGLFQCLCLWPGMSRSSSTIVGGWIGGLTSEIAAEFSFFLAIPIMCGASLLKLVKFQKNIGFSTLTDTQTLAFVLGFFVAFLVALLCVKSFISFIQKKPMKVFAWYRIGLSILILVLALTKVISI